MFYDLITSDLHLGHVNIIEYSQRPHRSVDEMNEDIILRWNAQVAPSDQVLIVGDLLMGKITDTITLVSRLNGHLHLRTGNHDRGAPMHGKRAIGWDEQYLAAGIETIAHGAGYLDLDAKHRHLLVCHFPYAGDSGDRDRYVDERPVDQGQWLIHGHVHEKWLQRGRQINVGLDAWGGVLATPAQIAALIDAGPRDLPRIDW
jgi:calcineurin-like phosphoesterase family protein